MISEIIFCLTHFIVNSTIRWVLYYYNNDCERREPRITLCPLHNYTITVYAANCLAGLLLGIIINHNVDVNIHNISYNYVTKTPRLILQVQAQCSHISSWVSIRAPSYLMCHILDPTTCGLSCVPRSYFFHWLNSRLLTRYGDTGECTYMA